MAYWTGLEGTEMEDIKQVQDSYIGLYTLGRGEKFVPALLRMLDIKGTNPEAAAKFQLPTMADPDYIVVLGGDGTVLKSERDFPGVPKLCIGAGKLSFLSTVEAGSLKHSIDLFRAGRFKIDERLKIETKRTQALNEISFISHTGKLAYFSFSIDGKLVDSYASDGIVTATPTGSTAHALSAGGPVLDPSVDAFVVVPLAPFRLRWRPYVVPADSKIKISLTDGVAHLVVDGIIEDKSPKSIEIERSKTKARFVDLGIHTLYSRLSKMFC
jgi:NAD+ kinase